jgi:hypothetical protein
MFVTRHAVAAKQAFLLIRQLWLLGNNASKGYRLHQHDRAGWSGGRPPKCRAAVWLPARKPLIPQRRPSKPREAGRGALLFRLALVSWNVAGTIGRDGRPVILASVSPALRCRRRINAFLCCPQARRPFAQVRQKMAIESQSDLAGCPPDVCSDPRDQLPRRERSRCLLLLRTYHICQHNCSYI